MLLAASLVFYLWGGAPAALSGGADCWRCPLFVSYVAANTLRKHRRKSVLLAVVCYHIAVLGIFKFTGFFTRGAMDALVPLGISFFTLPADLGHLREVYAGTFSQVPTPADTLTYSFFFPTVSSWSHLEAGEFLPPAAGDLSPAPGYRSRFVRHRPRPCQKGAAGGAIWACAG